MEAPEASTVADIGAGTGSYARVLTEQGYRVLAVEPSVTMRNQVIANHAIQSIDVFTENLTLLDQSVAPCSAPPTITSFP